MDLPDTIGCTGILRGGKTEARIAMLFAGEGNARAVDRIAPDNIQDFGVFFAWRSKSLLSRRHVVKEIFDLPSVSGSTSAHVGAPTVIWVPPRPAVGLGSALCPGLAGLSLPSA